MHISDVLPGDLLVCYARMRTFVTSDLDGRIIAGRIHADTPFYVMVINIENPNGSGHVYGLTSLGYLGWMWLLSGEVNAIIRST